MATDRRRDTVLLIIVLLVGIFLILGCEQDPIFYNLTVQVEGQGTVSPAVGSHSYEKGSLIHISATPSTGWEFKEWVGDVANTGSSNTSVVMDREKTVWAIFEEREVSIVEYILTMEIEGEGTVTPDVGPHRYEEGTLVPITATPKEGYGFKEWVGDVANKNSPDTSVLMDRDKIVRAVFIPVSDYYTLDIYILGEGSVETDPQPYENGYRAGTTVHLKAIPSSGWEFDGWMGKVAHLWDEETTILMDRDQGIIAFFIEVHDSDRVTLTVEKEGEGSVVPPVGTHRFEKGSWVDLKAIPSEDSRFIEWMGEVEEKSKEETRIFLDTDRVVKAIFEELGSLPFIVSIQSVEDIEVFYGTPESEALRALSPTTTITDSTWRDHTVSLTWSIEDYNEFQANDYVATGTFDLPEGVDQSHPPMLLEITAFVTLLPQHIGGEYSLSGRVIDTEDQGIPGVTISFGDGFSSVMTLTDGTWSKSGLEGTVTVTPKKDGFTFSPSHKRISYSSERVDFIGLAVSEQTNGESIVIKDTVKPMTRTEAENILSFSPEENRITFRERTEYVKSLREGDILLSDPRDNLPFGLIHRITSRFDNGLTCMLEDATLEEVIEEGDLTLSHSYTFEEFVEGMVLAEGVTIQEIDFGDHKIKFERDLGDDRGKITGFIRLHSTVDFNTDISYLRLRLNNFKFLVTVDFELDMNYEGLKEKEMKTSYDIIEFRSPPIPIFTGVWMTPSILFRVGAEAKIEAGMEWGVNYGRTYQAGIEYDRVTGFDSILQQSGDGFQIKRVSLVGKAEALAFGGMQVGFFVWGSAGVAAGIFGYGHAEGKVEMDYRDWAWEYNVNLGVKMISKAKLKLARIAELTYDGPELDLYRFPIAYAISGRATVDINNEVVGLEDVILMFEYKEPDHLGETHPTEVKTSEEGFWKKGLLTREVFVKSKKDGFSFTPEKVEVDRGKSDVNFLAEPIIPHLEEILTQKNNLPFIVTIRGEHFLDEQNGSQVLFGELEAEVLEWSDTEIQVEAPTNLPIAQSVDITVILGVHKVLPGGFENLKSNALEWRYPPVFILPPRFLWGQGGEFTHTFEAITLVEQGNYRFVWDFDDWREEADDTFVHVGESSTVSYTYVTDAPIAIMWSVYPTVELYTTGGEYIGEDQIKITWSTF